MLVVSDNMVNLSQSVDNINAYCDQGKYIDAKQIALKLENVLIESMNYDKSYSNIQSCLKEDIYKAIVRTYYGSIKKRFDNIDKFNDSCPELLNLAESLALRDISHIINIDIPEKYIDDYLHTSKV